MKNPVDDDGDLLADNELIEKDEELDKQIDWEEELEKEYGQSDEEDERRAGKMAGGSLARQKQTMEANKYYQGSRQKPAVRLVDRTKSK